MMAIYPPIDKALESKLSTKYISPDNNLGVVVLTYIKSGLGKIGNGLLYGVGIGITSGLISYFLMERMQGYIYDDVSIKQVVISNHHDVKLDNQVYVLGSLENKSSKIIRSLSLEVDFYNKNGEFIEQYSEYLRGSIKPKEKRNFKIECGCEKKPAPDYASYKIHVVGI